MVLADASVWSRSRWFVSLREVKVMFGPLKKVARALRVPTAEERELQYLSAAGDRIELEYRQREIDRGLFRRGPFGL